MSDYILREDALSILIKRRDEILAWPVYSRELLLEADHINKLIKPINDLPAADVAPVVRETWGEDSDDIWCPACMTRWNKCDNDTETFNFCPKCGARMDGGSK